MGEGTGRRKAGGRNARRAARAINQITSSASSTSNLQLTVTWSSASKQCKLEINCGNDENNNMRFEKEIFDSNNIEIHVRQIQN